MQSNTHPPRPLSVLQFVWKILCAFLLGTQAHAQAPLRLPSAVAFDAQGDLYVAETEANLVRRMDTAGVVTVVAGSGIEGFSGDGGPAIAAQLDVPIGLAVDAAGDLYIADAHNHRVRRVDGATGLISTVAGTGSAGFSGDGGAATAARLNLPSAVVLDAAGDLYIADTSNHRIRRVDAATGAITTVTGDGVQGFAGDGGPATAASLDSPSSLAVSSTGDLYLADTGNQRIRVVRAATGRIETLAGAGIAGFAGDGGAAAKASLNSPLGIALDAAGDVYIADAGNQRIRRIAPDGTIATIAGDGTQAMSGDGGAAVAASLDTPRAVAFSPAGALTLADAGNGRVRQVGADGIIRTVVGPGASSPEALMVAAPSSLTYGAGSLTATLIGAPATGSVSFFESTAAGELSLGTSSLNSNVALLSTAALSAGAHRIFAVYNGEAGHASVQSAIFPVTIAPAPVTASVAPVGLLYGQPVPALSGSLNGVLAQDAGRVALSLTTTAAALSPVGSYPITATLSGVAAGDYTLAPLTGVAVMVNKAPSTVLLAVSSLNVTVGTPVSVTVAVRSGTSGTPTGSVTLLDGGAALATLPLVSGDALLTTSALSAGTHALTAIYSGDANFAASGAATQAVAVSAAPAADFTLTATGTTTQLIDAGGTATFSFNVQTQGPLASPITLAASTLPTGMTASFNPSYLPPGGTVSSFTMTVQPSQQSSGINPRHRVAFAVLGVLLMPLALRWRRRLIAALLCCGLLGAMGCGDRIYTGDAAAAAAAKSYTITVSGTATSPAGAVLQHTATVTLQVK